MMFANYLKSTLRNATGSALYSAINITGLGVGLACCLLILLFVRHELSYESGFTNADRIYRVSREIFPVQGARARIPAMNNWPIGEVLPQAFSEIETMGRLFGGSASLTRGELTFDEPGVRLADGTIPQIFNFEWLAGDAATALVEPYSIVLTETLARKYFGGEDALGQTLEAGFPQGMRVTGVIRDIPDNTHLDVTGMMSLATLTQRQAGNPFETSWNNNTDFHTYILLREGATTAGIEAGTAAFLDTYVGENASQFSTLKVMNIRDIHLRSDHDEEMEQPGSINTVYGFAGVAFSILLIACINFVSISTARSAQRAREVGVRRAIGASRRDLIVQFLGESSLTTLVSIAIALVLVELALPPFSAFTGIDFTFSVFADPGILIGLVALTLFTAVAAGSYPAFFLANLGSGRMLRGHMTRDAGGLRFRNSLVIIQFAIAIALVISTAVIYFQRQYASQLDLGFDRNGVVIVDSKAPQGFRSDLTAFKQELLSSPTIESVTASHYLPFGFNDNQMPVLRSGLAEPVRIQYMMSDYDFFETYHIDTVAGRVFSPDFPGDTAKLRNADNPDATTGFVLNAAAARALGFESENTIDQLVRIPAAPDASVEITGPVIGVVDDTYFESVRVAVRPMIYIMAPASDVAQMRQAYRNAAIRVDANATSAALAHIEATWQRLYPGQAFDWHYLSDDLEALYVAEERQGTLLMAFSMLAILIACFGLFGLASFNAERRTKEIGVRKVMGGSVWSIVLLLTNDFSRLVLLSNLIAWPLAYFTMSRWLENFAYRIDLTPLVFIGSGLIALCIAWVTVGGTAAKAASAKPVLALRYE